MTHEARWSDTAETKTIDSRRWWVLWTVIAAQFMFAVDAFVVNVAIPTIRADLHASAAEVEAVIAVYLIAYATLVIIGGRLGDLYGVKPVFLWGLTGFTLASVWCGLAGSAAELILARLAQGATAALMVPQVLATTHVLFQNEERARAFAMYGLALGFGGAVGFVLGGFLVTLNPGGLGWRSVFFVNAPVGLAIATAAWRLMPRVPPHSRASLDLAGAGVLFVGLFVLIGPILFGQKFHWAAWLWPVMLLSALIIAGFSALERWIERRGGTPLVPSSLMADRPFLQGLGATFCFFSGNLSFYLVLTVFLQGSLHYSPWETGIAVLPLALAFVLGSRQSMARSVLSGASKPIAGCAVQIVGLSALGLLVEMPVNPGIVSIALTLVIFGYGQGLVMAPLSSTVLATVPKADAGAAAGIYATTVHSANAAGVAAIGALFFAVANVASDRAGLLIALAATGVMVAAAATLLVWRRNG